MQSPSVVSDYDQKMSFNASLSDNQSRFEDELQHVVTDDDMVAKKEKI